MLEGLYGGNKKVARAFMEKYAPYVHAVAVKVRTRDPSWAFEDLVSEAFLHLFEKDYRRLKAFQFHAKLSAYIFRVVRRHLITKVTGRN